MSMEKRKFSFNIIDILIVVFVIGAAAAAYLLFFRDGGQKPAEQQASPESFKVRYVVRVDRLPAKFQDNVNVEEQEKFIDAASQCSIGKVVNASPHKYYYLGIDKKNGEQVRTLDEDYVNLYITVEANATFVNNQYMVNGANMYIGKKFDVMMQNLFCSCTCVEIERVE